MNALPHIGAGQAALGVIVIFLIAAIAAAAKRN